MAKPRPGRPPAGVALPPRRLAVAGALAGLLIAQVTGLVVALLLRATEGEVDRIPPLVSMLTGMALGVLTGWLLCRMQGRSMDQPGPRHTYALVAVTFAGLAAGEALRWAVFRPWEAANLQLDYAFVAGAGLAGAAWQVWFILIKMGQADRVRPRGRRGR